VESHTDNTFATQDINLAAFLHSKRVKLIGIKPIDKYHSEFVFEQPSQELLNAWLQGNTPEKAAVESYRHLLKDSRDAWYGKEGRR